MQTINKDILDVITEAIRVTLLDTNTAIPAIVQSVSDDKKTVTLNLCSRRLFDDGEGGYVEKDYKPVPNIPVSFPSAGDFTIAFPVVAGDEGLLIFSQRDIKEFIKSGAVSTPSNLRKHALEDGVFLPTLLSSSKSCAIPDDGVVISAGDSNSITITDGGITISGDVTFEDGVTMEDTVTMESALTVIGTASTRDIDVTGNVDSTGTVTGAIITDGTIDLATHTHLDSMGGPTGPALP